MSPGNQIIDDNYLGKFIKINESRNTKNSNRYGTVVNETKNMLYLINHKSKNIIKIPKVEICEYEIYYSSGTCTLDGKRLLGRPEELVNKVK
jgi:RNase P/RNase MRP subunit p29